MSCDVYELSADDIDRGSSSIKSSIYDVTQLFYSSINVWAMDYYMTASAGYVESTTLRGGVARGCGTSFLNMSRFYGYNAWYDSFRHVIHWPA